jgi:hypothetical protein
MIRFTEQQLKLLTLLSIIAKNKLMAAVALRCVVNKNNDK